MRVDFCYAVERNIIDMNVHLLLCLVIILHRFHNPGHEGGVLYEEVLESINVVKNKCRQSHPDPTEEYCSRMAVILLGEGEGLTGVKGAQPLTLYPYRKYLHKD